MTRVRCLLTAIDAKERQLWVNRLRATAEYHTASMAPVRSDDGVHVVSNSVVHLGRTGVWGHYNQPFWLKVKELFSQKSFSQFG